MLTQTSAARLTTPLQEQAPLRSEALDPESKSAPLPAKPNKARGIGSRQVQLWEVEGTSAGQTPRNGGHGHSHVPCSALGSGSPLEKQLFIHPQPLEAPDAALSNRGGLIWTIRTTLKQFVRSESGTGQGQSPALRPAHGCTHAAQSLHQTRLKGASIRAKQRSQQTFVPGPKRGRAAS